MSSGRARNDPGADTQLLDALAAVDGVDPQAGLAAIGGNVATYRRLLAMFLATHAGDADRIVALDAAGDRSGARSVAHRLRGSAATLGLVAVDVAADAVERAVPGSAESLREALHGILAPLRAALEG